MSASTTNSIAELRRLLHEQKAREQRAMQDNQPDPFGACNEGKYDNNHRLDTDIGVPLCGAASTDVNAFQQHLANPDLEALTEAAERTNNPELVEHVLDEMAARVSEDFANANPGYLQTDLNAHEIVAAMAARFLGRAHVVHASGDNDDEAIRKLTMGGHWTPENLTETYKQLVAEGRLDVPPGTTKELTDRELLAVARLAVSDPYGAIADYVLWALGLDPEGSSLSEKGDVLMAVLNDPRYRELADKAVLFCWKSNRADYSPTAERDELLLQHAAGRALNFPLLNAAFDALKRQEQSLGYAVRHQAPPTQEEVSAAIEKLDDDDVQSTHRAVMTDSSATDPSGCQQLSDTT